MTTATPMPDCPASGPVPVPVKQVRVPMVHASCSSLAARMVTITLPRAPWENEP